MKRAQAVLLVAGFVALLAVPAWLYVRTKEHHVRIQARLLPALRELKQRDAEWNTDILKSRVGLHHDYDPVTLPERPLQRLRERLVKDAPVSPDGRLEKALARLEQAFVAKEDLVEQFKSQHAILNNSLRYFPTAVEEFRELLRQRRAGVARTDLPAAVGATIDHLLTDVLRFNLMPGDEQAARIAAAIGAIERDGNGLAAELREPLDLLLQHAATILRQRTVEDAVIADIAATATAQAIDEVGSALDASFQAMLQETQRYRNYLLVYSGLLLALLGYTAWRLAHSYHVIAQVNKRLQAANETLEQRVAERTAELELKSAQLAELAMHDTLTGLINRHQLMAQIAQALRQAERRGWTVALMFIDLDGFKAVNDSFGHATGDRVLQETAVRLRRHLRKEDAFARLGGDEFVILLNEVSLPHGAVRVAEAVLDELHAMREVDARPVRISASIGISAVEGASGTLPSPDALLSEADHAMYRAKQAGKGCYRFSGQA